MKKVVFLLTLAAPLFILTFCTSTTGKQNKSMQKAASVKNGIAVIELFTSHGCSSCPPADRLLAHYAAMENVFALSFHVDYWDKLGWKDPFSDAAFTQRQSMYAAKLKADVYTPQAIVNGQSEMVGSNEAALSAAVSNSLSEAAPVQIKVSNVTTTDTQVRFDYKLEDKTDDIILNVALVQNKITTSIKRGENEGLNLTNYNVVRQFKTIDPGGNGSNVSFQLPAGFNRDDLKIIVFIQMKKTYKIVGAAKFSL